MVKIFVENQPYEVAEGQNLLQACLSLGFDLPYFCWHPALGSVGACRQCAIKVFRDERDTRGRIVMACMTPVAEGTRLSINDPEAQQCRASLIEWLMTNHPHDCPICDEGGECHLQDMTVMTGHSYRRYRFKKRTYRNQNLGPFINHEMNRCIQCYRCVRFYKDYAGGHDLGAFASHNHVYFGRFGDGPLESEFSGNLVEVCPTGVFTDKTLKAHYTRKWDLQTAPSICGQCGLGCNTIAGERYGQLRRILNRFHSEINGYFLCDRGRFGYEFVNSARRLRQAWVDGQPTTCAAALERLKQILSAEAPSLGIGSPRASLEANYALRTLVGPDRFFMGMAEDEYRLVGTVLNILRTGPARSPSLNEVRQADAVFILGEDVTNTAPMLDLALRQAVRQRPMQMARQLKIAAWDDAAVREVLQDTTGPLFIATPTTVKLDEIATTTYRAAPDDVARLGFAVAHALDPQAPPVENLPAPAQALAQQIAKALVEAERPVIISGLSSGNAAIVQSAAQVAWALCAAARPAQLCFAMPEGNTFGLGLMGGGSLEAAWQQITTSPTGTVIILENDLSRRAETSALLTRLQASGWHVIAIDSLESETTATAEVVLPAATFAEANGTLVNNEGRAQRFYQVFTAAGDVRESWRWISDLLAVAGGPAHQAWRNLADLRATLAQALPAFTALDQAGPAADVRLVDQKIPRQPARYSGRTAMHANLNVHEPQPRDDPDTALAFSMEGYSGEVPGALNPRYWWPAWNSVQALNKFQEEVGGPLRGGEPGYRLVEPPATARPAYFTGVPPAFTRHTDEWLMVPLYHIFGSEPSSLLTPAIAERAPAAYLGLNPSDAQALEVKEGAWIDLTTAGITRRLRIRVIPTLPAGLAGLPVGLPGGPSWFGPVWRRLRQDMRKVYE
jgi:NADH-quinone oxidoreductase subunit G